MRVPHVQGGLGEMRYPLLSDVTKQISRDFGVLIEEGDDAGIALRRVPSHPVCGGRH